MSATQRFRIAAIPADGVGQEVVAAGRTVLDALANGSGGAFAFDWQEFGWGCEYYARTGRTGHAETVRVVFDPSRVSYPQLLKVFWESHDPTQGMRQGNDIGTQYRSAIFYRTEEQREAAAASAETYGKSLAAAGYGPITTEIVPAREFYFAEDYHQQYLYKVPNGYCPDHSTGVSCPVGLIKAD